MRKITTILTISAFLAFSTILSGESSAKMYEFFGGPDGGTYQYYANAIAELSQKAGMNVKASSSGGSVVNIRLVNSGKANFAVASSGDVFKAKKGKLTRDSRKYNDVMALGYFYSAAAQLVVRADSGITSANQLTGKKVGIGNFGSAAAGTCELFFTELGIWHKIQKKFSGYSDAADNFKKRQLDAFWVFTAFPNPSVRQAALDSSIALINIYKDVEDTDIFKKHPYLSKTTIPANTYKGIPTDTVTFQDAALWIASSKVPADDVYKFLSLVFSNKGLRYMVNAHVSAKSMSISNGVKGILTPLHPGAEKFWKEKGVLK